MTRAQIQTAILEQTGIKTSVSKMTGSMKHHTKFSVMAINGKDVVFPWEWRREFVKQFKTSVGSGNYHDNYQIEILTLNIEDGEPINYRAGLKPPTNKPETTPKGWGSKNSQMRLDKATSRYAKKLRKGGCARYC